MTYVKLFSPFVVWRFGFLSSARELPSPLHDYRSCIVPPVAICPGNRKAHVNFFESSSKLRKKSWQLGEKRGACVSWMFGIPSGVWECRKEAGNMEATERLMSLLERHSRHSWFSLFHHRPFLEHEIQCNTCTWLHKSILIVIVVPVLGECIHSTYCVRALRTSQIDHRDIKHDQSQINTIYWIFEGDETTAVWVGFEEGRNCVEPVKSMSPSRRPERWSSCRFCKAITLEASVLDEHRLSCSIVTFSSIVHTQRPGASLVAVHSCQHKLQALTACRDLLECIRL